MAIITNDMITPAVEARFWAKVKPCAASGCWNWTASLYGNGYAKFNVPPRTTVKASHFALVMSGRARPDGALALHSCDNPKCVNPSHLRWGTQKENIQDSIKRGRHFSMTGKRSGSNNPLSKLTEDDVRAIRHDCRAQNEIARDYGIGQDQVSRIKSGARWRHLL